MTSASRKRMYAAAEMMLPGLRPQNLAEVAQAAAGVAAGMLERGATTPTDDERRRLAAVADQNAARFLTHLVKPSTAEAWASFDLPWDYRRTLEAVRSGQYAADLLAEAVWAAERLAAVFADAPPRTARRARALGERELALHGGPHPRICTDPARSERRPGSGFRGGAQSVGRGARLRTGLGPAGRGDRGSGRQGCVRSDPHRNQG